MIAGLAVPDATGKMRQPAPVPKLLVELPERRRVFLENLRDLISPAELPPLELQSAPAPFWPDVFVKHEIPWRRLLDSGACHVAACLLLIGLSRLIALQPHAEPRSTFDHNQMIYYQAAEYLPPLDTRTMREARPSKADPELARQSIISVPREADNHSQTIVAPPSVKLKRDMVLPNIVAWSDTAEKPRLAIPAAPLTLAADLSRIAPKMQRSVVTPPPDAAHLTDRRSQAMLQSAIVAPPAELSQIRQSPANVIQPAAVIAPPPSVDDASSRPVGDLNIGRSVVIAPAPQLVVREQRAVPGGRTASLGGAASAVVAPPPALASGSAGESFGGRGHVIALNAHPTVGAPPAPPTGNRRGSFAASPEGRAGASGSAGSNAGVTASENATSGNGSKNLPAGLYVGVTAGAKSAATVGDAKPPTAAPAKPNPAASVPPTRVTNSPSRIMQPDSASKLSEAEQAVFGGRKFYSVSLNMPNLNSAGGSWVIHFAELNHESTNRNPGTPTADLSQPAATRKVDPAYPLQLMRENVSGTVILYAIIHADGTVGGVRLLRGVDDRLNRFAAEAIAQWKFEPATKNGTPVDVEATFQIPFRPSRIKPDF